MDTLPVSDLQALGGGGIAVALVWLVLGFLKSRGGRNGNGIERRLDTMIGQQKTHNDSSGRIEAQLKDLNDKFEQFWREMLKLNTGGD